MTDPNHGETIDKCLKACTAEERKAIEARTPPYDGVRTWGDLANIREQLKSKAKLPVEP